MIPWKILLGVVLFILSSFSAQLICYLGFAVTYGGLDYSAQVLSKILDVFAGSLLVWGFFDVNKKSVKR